MSYIPFITCPLLCSYMFPKLTINVKVFLCRFNCLRSYLKFGISVVLQKLLMSLRASNRTLISLVPWSTIIVYFTTACRDNLLTNLSKHPSIELTKRIVSILDRGPLLIDAFGRWWAGLQRECWVWRKKPLQWHSGSHWGDSLRYGNCSVQEGTGDTLDSDTCTAYRPASRPWVLQHKKTWTLPD